MGAAQSSGVNVSSGGPRKSHGSAAAGRADQPLEPGDRRLGGVEVGAVRRQLGRFITDTSPGRKYDARRWRA